MPKAARRGIELLRFNMENAQTGPDESAGLLKIMDKGLEDIRAVITCRVCVRPLYEPFTIECGHTFCYSCLVSWFEKNAANKSCPDCRAKIIRKPAPAYLVRDITQLFSTRAELLPAGETTQEHQDQQLEEARILEEDKNGRGLFRGSFRHEERHAAGVGIGRRIIIDDEDGVSRCPRCAWEMEDDMCAGCGWPGDADSWDLDSGSGVVSDEEELLRREMGIDGNEYGYESGIPSEQNLEDEDDEEDDSAGSLDGFVVNDEPVQEARHGPPSYRPIPWGNHNLGPRNVSRGRSSPLTSSVGDLPSDFESDSQALDHTSNDNTDAAPLSGGRSSRSMSARSLDTDNSPDTNENAAPNARSTRNRIVLDDSDDENVIGSPAGARHAGRHRPNRASSSARAGRRPIPREILQISSDSDELGLPRRTHMNRDTSNLTSNSNSHGAAHSLTSDEEDSPRNIQQRTMRRNARLVQATRRRATRPMVIDENDDDETMINTVSANGKQLEDEENAPGDDTFSGTMQVALGLAQQQSQISPGAQTLNGRTSDQQHNDLAPTSRFDPVTSIPVRRDNVNMPGAFPPSFLSEQGHPQSAPPVNAENFMSPSLPDRSSASRSTRSSEGNGQAFLDRRRREEHATYPTHTQQPRRRERSAAKEARRQERQRVKAEQEARARSRRGGGPSAPPLMIL